MASRSGRQGTIPPETKRLMEGGTSPAAVAEKIPSSSAMDASDEGCRICRRDEDHANLLLCEACNDEYHTYCLKPPLQSVPDDDWFCDQCKLLHSINDDDGLDSLVSALPPAYTSRFGEIVWAAGGNGFGWWPACIYDPRLTVGGARQLARKNLGKRHLIYFFECNDAPFTVLGDSRITKWEDGFIEEYDLGKTAKSGNKTRAGLFDKALHLAQMENDRPIEMRMDWNHQEAPQLKTPRGKGQNSIASHSAQHNENQPVKKQNVETKKQQHVENQPAKKQNTDNPPSKKKQKTQSARDPISPSSSTTNNSVNRKSINSTVGSLIESSEDGPLVCKILRRLPVAEGNPPTISGLEYSTNVGFITLPSRQGATFACIRKAVERELDEDCFPRIEGKTKWKFYVPKLGPVSIKQEKTLGPALEFLKGMSNDCQMGNGTPSSPLKIVLMDF